MIFDCGVDGGYRPGTIVPCLRVVLRLVLFVRHRARRHNKRCMAGVNDPLARYAILPAAVYCTVAFHGQGQEVNSASLR